MAAGCGSSPPSDLGSSTAAIVGATPVSTGTGTFAIPSLGVSGSWKDSSYTETSNGTVHGLTYTNGADLVAAPVDQTNPTETELASWVARSRGGTEWKHESTPAFEGYLRSAWNAGIAHLANLDSAKLKTLQSDLAGLGVAVTLKPEVKHAVPYAPTQTRWLRNQYAPNGKTSSWGPIQAKYEYTTPSTTAAVRQRAARLYCAARKAADVQAANPSSVMMGEQVALPLTIFGQRVDLGVVQATLAIDRPKKFTGGSAGVAAPSDGAQAFLVPLLAGVHAIPVRGIPLVPEFPELRHPIALVGGDSQVVSPQADESILTGTFPALCFFGTCTSPKPTYTTAPRKTWETATHTDALMTANAGLSWSTGKIPVMRFSFGKVDIEFVSSLDVGTPAVADDRALKRTHPAWSPLARPDQPTTPADWGAYNDSAWTIDSYYLGTSPTPPFFATLAANPWATSLSSATLMRLYENDDRHLVTQSALGIGAKLYGGGEADIAGLHLSLTGIGSVNGSIQLKHDLRDGVSAVQTIPSDPSLHADLYPFDNLLVTPKTSATVDIGLEVSLRMSADLGFAKLDHRVKLLDPKASKTWGDKPWEEKRRLRLGTGSDFAWASDLAQASWSMAHLPNTAAFSSFERTVDACLADETTPPSAPPPCPAKPGSGTVPSAEICVVMTPDHTSGYYGGFGTDAEWGADVCADPVGRANLMSADPMIRACYRSLLQYACSPVSRALDAVKGRAHVLRTDSASGTVDGGLVEAIKACLTAFPTAPGYEGDVVNRYMTFAACDASGRLLSKEETFSVAGSPGEPSPVGDGSCR